MRVHRVSQLLTGWKLPALLPGWLLTQTTYAADPLADVSVSGIVTDNRGEVLPGVSGAVKGITRGIPPTIRVAFWWLWQHWFDFVRTGRLVSMLKTKGKIDIKVKHMLFPSPQRGD